MEKTQNTKNFGASAVMTVITCLAPYAALYCLWYLRRGINYGPEGGMLAAFYFLCYLGAVLLIGPLLFAGTLVTKITQKSAVELALENLVIKLSCIPLYVYLLIDYFELFDSIILLNFGSLALFPAF